MKTQEETATFHCIIEYNDWEGETWYHYFLDEPGVLGILTALFEDKDEDDNDFMDLETTTTTWSDAERLTNQDHGEYMQPHWFGKLTNLEGLKSAASQDLYKGGIRKFGEELFSYPNEKEDQNV
jgi:hypothetical protein